ncbi:crotonase/enoyl-CoA hydratase family protein [Kiloniella sp. EL199]|uniref:crotonase/enoyl-CoA hydratase family protein n=1 Tax=Kiloniella sp. EL199 TaxID=2107581 RepID=UPI000EA221AF|nr:crotonase/enoyl-CoA hydratase family protein [Kiloniella sp. EL199]
MINSVLYELKGNVALLTLNRPEKLNALNYAMIDRLMELLGDIEDNDQIRVVIITGAGDRAFSAGGDIHEFSKSIKQGAEVAVKEFVRRGQGMTKRIEAYRKPVIVAVNGIAFGGGCEITEAAHIAIASNQSVFAKPEINIGIPPTFGGTQRLPRLAGRKRALELLLSGDSFSAEHAYRIGLVNEIVSHNDLLASAYSMADRITRHSPLAVSRIITAVTRGINSTITEGLQIESEQFARMAVTEDVHEGLNAWIERRVPEYRGC